jgi:hypothetical protein
MDPRVKATQNEIEQEFDLAMRLAPMVTRSSQAVMHSDSILEQIKKLSSQANGPLVESLKSLGQKVTAILGDPDSAQEPNLRATSTDVGTLYADAQKADAAPNAALVAASAETAGNLANLMKRWEELKTKDLPDMNRQLREALLPEINPESIPQAEQPHGDEE